MNDSAEIGVHNGAVRLRLASESLEAFAPAF